MDARIRNKSDISTNWIKNNPILLKGEIGIEENTNKIKIGDGIRTWSNLDYINDLTAIESQYLKITGGTLTSHLNLKNVNHSGSPSLNFIPQNSPDGKNSIIRLYAVQLNNNNNPVLYVQSGHGYNEGNSLLPGGEDYRTIITNIANPISSTDVVPKGYADANYLKLSGGHINGILTIERDRATVHTHPIYFNVADANSLEANAYTIQMVPYGSPTHPYFWLSGTGNKYDGQRVQFRNISDPTDPTEVATKNYVDTNCLKNTGGAIVGTVTFENNSQYSPNLRFVAANGVSVKLFATYTESSKEKRFAIQNTDNTPIILQGIANPTSNNDAVPKGWVESQFLKNTGGTVIGHVNIEYKNDNLTSDSPYLNFKTRYNGIINHLYVQGYNGNGIPYINLRYGPQEDITHSVIIRGVGNPVSNTDAVNLNTLNNRLAALEARLTGKIGADAPTLE